LRLLRLLKLRKMLADLQDHISSEYTYLFFHLVKLLCFILFLNHGIACAWYAVGRSTALSGPSWTNANKMGGRSLGYRYTTSLHWTLTQFTPASMEVFPQNTAERTMSVIVLMFALVAFSSFVGSISTSMTALRNMNADTSKQFWLLRRFLKQQTIPRTVGRRILKYLEFIVEKDHGKVQKDSIKILSRLSEQLHEELTFELTKPKIGSYLIFEYMLDIPGLEVVARRLTATALTSRVIASGDYLFYPGDEASNFYCFLFGCLDYTMDGEELKPRIQEKEWISEAALYTKWRHMGKLRALAETELMVWNVPQFLDVVAISVTSWTPLASFAKDWLELFAVINASDIIRDDDFRTEAAAMAGTVYDSTISPS